MGAASLSSCSLTNTTISSISSTRKSIMTNASSTPTPRIMNRPFKWSKPVRQKRIQSSNKETLDKWDGKAFGGNSNHLPFDPLPRSPYIFAGRQGCRALMARSPSHRIPQLRAPPWAKFLENQISGKIAGPKENTIIAIISVQVDKWRQKSSAECAWCFLAHW